MTIQEAIKRDIIETHPIQCRFQSDFETRFKKKNAEKRDNEKKVSCYHLENAYSIELIASLSLSISPFISQNFKDAKEFVFDWAITIKLLIEIVYYLFSIHLETE